MRRLLTSVVLTLCALVSAFGQDYNSAQSYKQGPVATQTVTSAAAGTGIDVTGYSHIAVMYKGTFTTDATAAGFQVSIDSGTTYVTREFFNVGSVICAAAIVTGDLTDNSTNVWIVPVAGFNRFRTNALNWATGTINVTVMPFSSPELPCKAVVANPNGTFTISGTVTIGTALPAGTNNIGDVDVLTLPALPAGTNNIGDVDVLTLPALPAGTNNIGDVDVLTLPSVTVGTFPDNEPINVAQINGVTPLMGAGNTGTGSPRVTIASDNAALATTPAGNVAHDAADSGNPVKVGARATNASITAVANNDRVDLITDLNARLVTSPYTVPENLISGVTAAVIGTTDTAIIAAQGVGVRIYVSTICVTNSHATVDTLTEIKDSVTVIWRVFAKSAGGGYCVNFANPIRLAANTALNGANITTGSNTYFSAAGFKAP